MFTFAHMKNNLKILSAPLQGFTDAVWREAHALTFGGIDTYYSPFLRVENGRLRNKDIRDVSPENNKSHHMVPQIIAGKSEELITLTDYLSDKGYKEIDVNMGCPFPLIANRGKGSGILPYPERVSLLIEAMNKYTNISFSVKMRLGWISENEWRHILPILNDANIKQVTLHPRIGKQQYKGSVMMNNFAEFYSECKLPLVYNGDLLSTQDIDNITKEFPALKGIMVGRGLLAQPALGMECKEGCTKSDGELYLKTYNMLQVMEERYTSIIEGGESQLLSKLKTIWEYLLPDMEKKARKAIAKSRNIQEYHEKIYMALHV